MNVLETKIKKLDLLEIDRKALAAGRDFIDSHVASAPSASPTDSHTEVTCNAAALLRVSPPLDIPTSRPVHHTKLAHNTMSPVPVSVMLSSEK